MKSYRYLVFDPSGKKHKFTCPSFYSPADVAERLPHHLVFCHVRKGHTVLGRDAFGRPITIPGEAWTYMWQGEAHYIVREPLNAGHAHRLIRDNTQAWK